MRKLYLLSLGALISLSQANAQRIDFPVGLADWDSKPEVKLVGAVRTVLTMEHRGDTIFDTTVENYDKQNKFIETIAHHAGIEIHSREMVSLSSKSVYIYDSSGKLSQIIDYNADDSRDGNTVFTYDAKSHLSESVYYTSEGEIYRRTNYVYYPERREVEVKQITYHEGRSISWGKVVLTYNEKNQWVKRTTYYSDGLVKDYVSFEYDDKGNLKKEKHCCKYNYSHLYTYKYDKQGNWIKQQNTYEQLGEDGKLETDPDWMYTYRVITYYEDKQTPSIPSALSHNSFNPTPR